MARTLPVGLLFASYFLIFWTTTAAQDYINEALYLHNHYRAAHQSPPLVLDSVLSSRANQCAQYLALFNFIGGECPYKSSNTNENRFYLWNSGRTPSPLETVRAAMKSWYKQSVKVYNYASPSYSPKTATFTQVIWRSSTRIGIGIYEDRLAHQTYLVCLYSPAGNVEGQYTSNVLPLQ